jgi:hypothetical protein
VGQIAVEEKTNEIPNLFELLKSLPVKNAVVTAVSLHTQSETARFIVEEKHADYLFIVKGNQSGLRQDISDLNLTAFPPVATSSVDKHRTQRLHHLSPHSTALLHPRR